MVSPVIPSLDHHLYEEKNSPLGVEIAPASPTPGGEIIVISTSIFVVPPFDRTTR